MSHRHSALRGNSARHFVIVTACTAALFAGCSASSEGDDSTAGGQGASLGGQTSASAGGANSALTGGKNATGGKKNTGGTKAATTTAVTCTPAMRGQQGCSCLDPLTTDGGPTCYSGTCYIVTGICCSALGDCTINPNAGTGGKPSIGGSGNVGGKTGLGGSTSTSLGGAHAGGTTHDSGLDEDAGFDEDASAGGGVAVGGNSSMFTTGTGIAQTTGGAWSSGGVPSTGGAGGAGGIGGVASTGGTGAITSCTLGSEQCGCFQDQCFPQWECYSGFCVDPSDREFRGPGTGVNTGCTGPEGCNCYGNHTCDEVLGLTCLSNLCVIVPAQDAGVDAG